jgi:hypothetical protein
MTKGKPLKVGGNFREGMYFNLMWEKCLRVYKNTLCVFILWKEGHSHFPDKVTKAWRHEDHRLTELQVNWRPMYRFNSSLGTSSHQPMLTSKDWSSTYYAAGTIPGTEKGSVEIKKKLYLRQGTVAHTCNLSYLECWNRRTVVRG